MINIKATFKIIEPKDNQKLVFKYFDSIDAAFNFQDDKLSLFVVLVENTTKREKFLYDSKKELLSTWSHKNGLVQVKSSFS